ncbi:hypothetical protein BO83DRAFT_445163 [Aspergillus eucalypticola CBS 122712]|uniref:Uncharacterized protein n=1 Tax=Aspergillus eucalypticola (strain CBS 122712 / IBT 29274) TaxID=1448314 RepID=A0A317VG43_ASPEC|nr:uncharacterized protein BO83DRAFT_445163 [Aspergillus eucalypticola CBS 122712]PWY73353.1 hypothetical protein BO83DRAFT_445163 [Aspergillus eucalypticola CBS 122712]
MSSSETPQHREIRHALRQIRNDIESLDAHQLDSSLLKKYKLCMSPVELDESSNDRPIFFKPCDASLLLDPDDQYDEGRSEYTDYDSWDPELTVDSTLTVLAACLTIIPTMFLRVPLAAKISFLGKPGLVSGKLASSSSSTSPPLLLFYSTRLGFLTLRPTVPAMSLSEGYGAMHILNMEL